MPNERGTWGARFKSRRLELGLTQETVAIRAGVTQQAISHFESDPRLSPRLTALERYAAALETTVEELFPMEARP